ncbi:MAG: G5 domain-containing protein [Oscillospiraceae bacterium]|nr:G5 domain-containing protein [Oscillospiraceae bacterium]
MTTAKRLFFSACRYLASRSFCYPVFLAAVTAVLTYTVMNTSAVVIVEGARQDLVYTTNSQATQAFSLTNIDPIGRYDTLQDTGVEGYHLLDVERAFPVYLTVDGGTRRIMTTEITLDKLLSENHIQLGEHDRIDANLRTMLSQGEHITIQRVEQNLVQKTNPIPFTVRNKSTSLLKNGRTRILQEGKTGVEVHTFSETTVDGIVQDRELLATDIAVRPTEQVVLVGDGSAISNFDFSDQYPLDANGVPLKYEAVFHNQVATGYWARNPIGASRMRCEAGTAAVRSSQFPYGTKLYVRTADGGFIYGYTVTNDTGVGLMQNIIDIDLYYESYLESALNGRRIVDIYVLEYSEKPTSGAVRR